MKDPYNKNKGFIKSSNLGYPLIGNYFDVVITYDKNPFYCSFQSISGLSKSTKTTKIQDGGDNQSEYHLPNHYTYKDVTLKRGVMKTENNFYKKEIKKWFENLGWNNDGTKIKTSTVAINIADANSRTSNGPKIKETITLYDAYPTSFALGELNSEKATVLIETVTLGFSKYEIESNI